MPTPCHREGCDNTAHVLLFAAGRQFLGRDTSPGQAIALCLLDAGQVLDVIHAFRDQHRATVPGWLADDAKADRLPTVLPLQGWADAGHRRRGRPRAGRP